MDLSFLALERIFGKEPQNVVRVFLFRMWCGYSFDAGEMAFLWIHVGISYISEIWWYVFYGYCGFLGLVALLLTCGMIKCIIGTDLRRYTAIPYFMAYFKLTSAVNAGFIFFQLWFSGNRDAVVITLMVFTGIDMALDLIEMELGFAGLNSEKIGKKQVHIDPVTDIIPRTKY